MAFLYLDPNDRGWRTLAARCALATADLVTGLPNAARLPALVRAVGADPSHDSWSALTDALGLPAADPDPRLRATLAALHADPGGAHPVDAAAAAAGYSLTAFQRRFTSSAGLPWRRYRLWLRIRHAVRLASSGASLTDAAHAAGFASSAHFSSSFKAMFGMPPAQLIGAGVRWRVLR
jgi:AraC-like DNA-binding protein